MSLVVLFSKTCGERAAVNGFLIKSSLLVKIKNIDTNIKIYRLEKSDDNEKTTKIIIHRLVWTKKKK